MSGNSPRWQAWVDGTALPNPGRIGTGLLLVSPDGEHRERSNASGHSGCNNDAEVRAILAALEVAETAGARRVTIYSDSRFAVDCLSGFDNTTVPRLAELLATTRTAIGRFEEVLLVWLPRHRNAKADRLARAALGLVPKPLPSKPKRRR